MKTIRVVDVIPAPIEEVWALVGDFGGLEKWAPITSCSLDGSGVGAVRTVAGRGPFGRELRVRERLASFDADAKVLTYSIVGKSPLPVVDFLARIALKSDAAGDCIIDWSCTFRPRIPGFLIAPIIKSTYKSGIEGLKSAIALPR